jgi:hypothetical protein
MEFSVTYDECHRNKVTEGKVREQRMQFLHKHGDNSLQPTAIEDLYLSAKNPKSDTAFQRQDEDIQDEYRRRGPAIWRT